MLAPEVFKYSDREPTECKNILSFPHTVLWTLNTHAVASVKERNNQAFEENLTLIPRDPKYHDSCGGGGGPPRDEINKVLARMSLSVSGIHSKPIL
jgi:hypothetical protein